MEFPQVEFYPDKSGDWRWRIRARNHRIIAEGGEGYETKAGCVRAYERLAHYMTEEVIEQKFLEG